MSGKRLIITIIMLLFSIVDLAAVNIDSLKNEANNSRSNSKIDILNEVAEYYLKSKSDSAIYYSKLAVRLSNSFRYNEGKISSLNILAFAFYIKNQTDSAKIYSKEALNLSRKFDFNLGKAQALNILGLTEWRIGSYPNAVDHYLKALDFATLSGDKFEIAKSNNYLGLVYWKTGNYPKSINYYFNALELKQELNNSYEVALTLNNLSSIHNEIGDYEQAIVFAIKALEISEKIDSKYTLGRALGNLGVCYLKMDQTEKALEFLTKALNVKKESGELRGLGYTFIDVGNIHFQLKDYTKAEDFYNEALEIMTKNNDAHGLSTTLNKLANVSFVQKKYGASISSLEKSNKFARREDLRENIKENFFLYSQIYEKQGKNLSAYKNYKLYSELKDSLTNEKSNSRIKELNINYETNQKEKENELLKQSNTIQSLELERQKQYIIVLLVVTLLGGFVISGIYLRYNYLKRTKKITEQKNKKIEMQKSELKQLNATKDKFFSILAHDLKNPFQTILGYSNLLSTDYDELTEEERQDVIGQILNVSKSSFQLLENLLSWANNQTGRIEYIPTELNLLEIIEESLKPIFNQAQVKKQKIDIVVDSKITALVDKNIISTVIRNLVTNAVKFSKVDGNIIIEAIERNADIVIKIEDNGLGIEATQIGELFTLRTSKDSIGTAAEKGTGLGLVICREFVEIYNGKIWAESELGKGSKFFFTVPQA